MEPDDVEAVDGLSSRCFDDLTRRLDLPTPPNDEPSQEQIAASHRRLRHLLNAHAAGAWVIDGDDGPLAAALALRHEDFWGLSLLVVDPAAQGRGLGRAALQAAMTTGEGAGRGLILSSLDPRATRLYRGAGFAEHPGLRAFGRVNRDGLPHQPATVREAREDDRELAADVDRAVRGGPHGTDLEPLLAAADSWWAVDARGRRGYAILVKNRLALLAAEDIDTARALLVRCLAEADADKEVAVPTLNGATRWAVEILRGAGPAVHPSGPFFTRGFDPPPLYLPNPAWL
ncbi:MAG TPA: GNAT family N-acetyltransferase, partial [Egibacteraceae bacterium]|nr:GNAT family N-acetyltransferase [Egibacteraceae bacterium]